MIRFLSVIAFILLFNTLLSAVQEHNILRDGRELNYSDFGWSQNLDSLFSTIRHFVHIDSLPIPLPYPYESIQEKILAFLIEGEYNFKGPIKNESEAYSDYLIAYQESINSKDEILICESLKKLLAYQIFTNNDESSFYEYLALHKSYTYDRIEEMYNEYYRLRGMMQFAYARGEKIYIPENDWMDLIEECAASGFHRLETDLRSIYGVYLEIHAENFERAKVIYESALRSAGKVNPATFEIIQFSSWGNIGAMYHALGEYELALKYLIKTQKLNITAQRPRNQVFVYDWLSKVYNELGLHDSAYHYLKKGYDTNQQYELNEHTIAVNAIQEQYQNETLKSDLFEQELQRNRYFLLAWIFGGLFLIGSIVYFFYARLSRLKSINLQQNLKNLEKESLLRAVNAKIDGEEEERRRVASVLHDNIATHLAASRMHLKVIRKKSKADEADFEKTDNLLGEISTKVRQLSHELYPPALYQLGLLEALESLCEKYTNPTLTFQIEGDSVSDLLSKDQKVRLYFIIQEIINNVIKHSKASLCQLELRRIEDSFIIKITDNGVGGIELSQSNGSGLGLYSVKARIEDMKGNLSIQSPENKGTSISLSIPLQANLVSPHL